jgi:hypothetical protein
MEKLEIYKYQAKAIHNALRLANRALKSDCKGNKQTCMDRDIVQALKMIENVLAGDIETLVERF